MPLEQAPPASDLLVQTTNTQSTTTASAGVQAVPAGAMFPFAAAVAPSGYLICDGSAVSRTTYSALFTVIGTTYGVGDGSTTFNLPDAQARTVFGLASSGHTDVATLANNDGTALASRRPTHKHTVAQPTIVVTDPGHSHVVKLAVTLGSGILRGKDEPNSATDRSDFSSNSATTGITATATGGTVGVQTNTPTDTVPYIVMPWIIKT